MNRQISEIIGHFESDIEGITQVLAKITTLNPEQIKPHLDTLLEQLVKLQVERPVDGTLLDLDSTTPLYETIADNRDTNKVVVKPQTERPLYETATPSQLSKAFREWADSHDGETPLLSDYAVSRESMYSDEE